MLPNMLKLGKGTNTAMPKLLNSRVCAFSLFYLHYIQTDVTYA